MRINSALVASYFVRKTLFYSQRGGLFDLVVKLSNNS